MTEETLFAEALAQANPAQRAAYLDEACGSDPALRSRVEDLLKAHQHAGSFLEHPAPGEPGTEAYQPAPEGTTVDDPAARQADTGDAAPPGGAAAWQLPGERPGAWVGPYQLMEKLGEGGMGTVWRAEQAQPVKRAVALKVVKAGMDSAHVLARFEAERQALALMDHPHIARVLDAGATESGRPYFVMELVQGLPITRFCDQQRLTPRQRLELFLPVCQAVQHAHQKAIIHRDLKPSNVLVALYDGKPVPKVIDFGIAKALHQKLTERTMVTEVGAIVGTLEYMAPEQADLNNLDIDTRADVYSLGVLLYELLTGVPPFSSRQLRSASFTDMLRMIREVEPLRPGARLSSSAELPAIAARRSLEPKKLARLVTGDLDWIAMKCLEKDRTRRYETASGLALEIHRYLADEPVLAGPPSVAYRLRKFVRRNKGPVLATALLFLALAAGVMGTTVGLFQTEAARANEARQKETAQKRLGQVEKANEILADVFRDLDPHDEAKGGPALRAQLGDRLEQAALALEGEATGDPLVVARLQNRLGLTLLNLGYPQRAIDVLTRAHATRAQWLGPDDPDLLESMHYLAGAYRSAGRLTEAVQRYEELVPVLKARLGPDAPDTLASMSGLALVYQGAGRQAEALRLFEEVVPVLRARLGPGDSRTLGSMNGLALAYREAGRLAEAVQLYEAIVPVQKAQRGPQHLDTLQSMNGLATAYHAAGRLAEAIQLYEEIVPASKARLGPDNLDTLAAMNNLAAACLATGRLAEAIQLNEEVLRTWKTKLGADHPDVLTSMNNLASIYQAAGRLTEAVQLFEEVVPARKTKLGPDHPHTLGSINNLARAYEEVGRVADAVRLLEELVPTQKARLGPNHPDTLASMNNLAGAYGTAGRLPDAIRLYEEVVSARKSALGADHLDTLTSMGDLAEAYRAVGRLAEAIPLLEEILPIRKALLGPDHPYTLSSMNSLASAYWRAKRLDRSVPLLEEALRLSRAKLGPDHPSTLRSQVNLGVNLRDAGRIEEGIALLEEALRRARARPIPLPPDLDHLPSTLAVIYEQTGRYTNAEPLYRGLLEEARQHFGEAAPRTWRVQDALGRNLLRQEKYAAAEPLLRACLQMREPKQPDDWTTFNTRSLLGGSLLGQQKYAEAEPLLVLGYEGMKQREARVPPPGTVRLTEALERLVQLYEAWGKKDEAARWRKELEARKPAQAHQP